MCTNAIANFDTRNIQGNVKFHQCENTNETLVIFNLSGLFPGKIQACHIHEYGDESQGCKSLGAHWNPHDTSHGHTCMSIPRSKHDCSYSESHAGDLLNNIKADERGLFRFRYMDSRLRLKGDVSESIIGRSVVIHDGIDDLGMGGNAESLKTGNAGDRLACAIIGHSK